MTTKHVDILETMDQAGIELRRIGREYYGPCPFHDDRNPSFRVNKEKQLWYCDPCATGGNVFDFIMKLRGLTFPQALRALGVDEQGPKPKLTPSRRRAAALAAAWTNEQRSK